MDFAVSPGVTAALCAAALRGTHGYYSGIDSMVEALVGWMDRRHGWTIDPASISATPGVVSGLALILQALTSPGDEVVVFSPCYHAFKRIIFANDRRALDCRLEQVNGRYAMNLEGLRQKLSSRTKIVFFCSPHNPGGTVWSHQEIRALAEFCAQNNLILVSDEIHCDLVSGDKRHTPAMVAAPECAERLITCVAASKTFNLAASHVAACITPNSELKRKLETRAAACGISACNGFGMIATEAAWRTGEPWLEALLPYLAKNRDVFEEAIEAAAPGASATHLEGTYLAWVDFSGTGLLPKDVLTRVARDARIFASPGDQFGPGGETWLRFNIATPRPILNEAIGRLHDAFADLRPAGGETGQRLRSALHSSGFARQQDQA